MPIGIHAAGVSLAGLPAALVVARSSKDSKLTILSIAVSEPFRGIGLARDLMTWLINEAKRLNYSTLVLSFPRDHFSTFAMESLTNPDDGWKHCQGLSLIHISRPGCKALLRRLAENTTLLSLGANYQVLPWGVLSMQQRQQLKLVEKAPEWADPALADCGDGIGKLDEAVSQVLFSQLRPVGWLIAHRVGYSRIRITAWWVQKSLQGRGIALLLLKAAISYALQCKPHYISGCFGVAPANTAMKRFSNRHLEPLSDEQHMTTRAVLRLQ